MNFLSGNNFDKAVGVTVTKKINRDQDIQRLLRMGKNPWKLFFSLIIFSVFLYFTSKDLFAKFIAYPETIDFVNNALFVTLAFLIWEFKNLKDTIHGQTKEIFNLWTYFKYVRSARVPSAPTDLWHYFGANPSDAQILIPASKVDHHNTFIYTGQPYFKVRCVDTITLKFNGSFLEYIKLHKVYKTFFKNFAIRTLTSYTEENQVAIEERRLKNSFSVFGILFCSELLKTFFEHSASFKNENRVQLRIQITDSEQKAFAEEWLKLCTHKDVVEISGVNQAEVVNPMFTLNDLSFLEKEKKKSKKWAHFLRKEFKIPVKKFVALPTETSKINQFIECEEAAQLMSLGGAEQNIGLVYLVNKARWENVQDTIGIAENIFDDYRYKKFSVGTESLVYGVKNEMIGRGQGIEKREANAAEVFSFNLKKLQVICVYGYSAPITKMAAICLLENIKQQKDEYLPTKASAIKDNLVYQICLPEGDSFYQSELLKNWDAKDYINENYEEFLRETEFHIV